MSGIPQDCKNCGKPLPLLLIIPSRTDTGLVQALVQCEECNQGHRVYLELRQIHKEDVDAGVRWYAEKDTSDVAVIRIAQHLAGLRRADEEAKADPDREMIIPLGESASKRCLNSATETPAPFHFDFEVEDMPNAEMPKELHRLMRKWAPLVPHWVRWFTISHSTKEKIGGSASSWSAPEYLYAGMEVTANWWSAEPVYRELMFVHELVHTLESRMLRLIYDRVFPYIHGKSEEVAAVLKQEFDLLKEERTQHLAILISGCHPCVASIVSEVRARRPDVHMEATIKAVRQPL